MADDGFRLTDEARGAAGSAWFDYLELLDPFRADLFRYCRRLTGDLWDAEDLVQDTLEQGFAKLASVHHSVTSPRAYVLRIASNLWVDRIRRRSAERASIAREASDPTHGGTNAPRAGEGLEVRDAGAVLLRELAPQERAALVLKEVLDLPLDEIAAVLRTTTGAVKSALHRGRDRLRGSMQDETPRNDSVNHTRPMPSAAAVDRFVECYNARDLPALLELMLDSASVEMYGHVYESGREAFERKGGWFHHNFYNPFDGGPSDAVWEVVDFRGEPVVLVLYGAEGERVVGSVMRFEDEDERIARIRVYALCPDVVAEVAGELGRAVSPVQMYRFPLRPDFAPRLPRGARPHPPPTASRRVTPRVAGADRRP
jgi:RNA polymerase sigma-70 factor (ECF subfamily)